MHLATVKIWNTGEERVDGVRVRCAGPKLHLSGAPAQSITSSARKRTSRGIISPSDLVVVAFTTNSKRVGCSTCCWLSLGPQAMGPAVAGSGSDGRFSW